MENTIENKETIIEEVIEKKEKEVELGMGTKIAAIAVGGAMKQLADKNLYYLGAGVGLLFGKKAGLKAMGSIVAVGAIWNTARYMTGEYDKD